MKKTWRPINKTLSEDKISSQLRSIFYHNDLELTNPTEIADAFNMQFANIGKDLAAEIEKNITKDSDFTQYLTAPSLTKCKFRCVTQAEIIQAIDNLENKNSFGHDEMSNKLLKFIKYEIISSLTLIVNQMITTGIFPDSFKNKKIYLYLRRENHHYWLTIDLFLYCPQYPKFLKESSIIKCMIISMITIYL